MYEGRCKRILNATVELEAERDRLRKALQGLYNEQNGPHLLRHEKRWQAAMDEAEALLKSKA